ncbi:hypothetical protein B0H17DRAFT_1215140 [Mycena rosella]|uniref:Transmembrane protein n=1 Tax=Mycena rosella TaxID=1033263 RepID=A0AAD7G281_MYCRO|nr:hypothetical protein B0H17DRAFT_1215140 [Mycena rosella]
MTGRGVSWPLRLTCLYAVSTLAAHSLDGRAVQSQANCIAGFDWADNQENLSPCLLSSAVWAPCFTGGWNTPPLPGPGLGYDKPNSTTANLCTCSWAAYNLLSACTVCQGFDAAVENWAAYDQNCGAFLETDTYYPSNVTLPTGTAIPFWATTNPTTWNDGRFDSSQAQLIAQQNSTDVNPNQPPSAGTKKSKTPIGPIVGGVIGGLAVLAIGGAVAFWFLRRRGDQHAEPAGDYGAAHSFFSRPQIHGRSLSDISGKSILLQQSMSVAHSARPGTIYTTATAHTHTGSVHSLSFGGSGYASPTRVMSPPPTIQVVSREDIIEPFTLRPTSPPAPTRKTSETTMRTAYTNQESLASPPSAFMQDLSLPEVSQRMRLNPPAYSPYASPASSPEPMDPTPQSPTRPALGHRTRSEKASVDSQQSYASAPTHGHGGGESISAIDDVVGRMGLTVGPETVVGSTVGGHTISTGQSANVVSSRPAHKPSISNPNNDTLG